MKTVFCFECARNVDETHPEAFSFAHRDYARRTAASTMPASLPVTVMRGRGLTAKQQEAREAMLADRRAASTLSVRDAQVELSKQRDPDITRRLIAEEDAAMVTKLALGPRSQPTGLRDLSPYPR